MNRSRSDVQAFERLKAAAREYAAWVLSTGRSFVGGAVLAESKLADAAVQYAVAREVVTRGTKR